MRCEEVLSLYVYEVERKVNKIGAMVRAKLARRRALVERSERYRQELLDFKREHFAGIATAHRRERERVRARELELESSVKIQKVYRGVLGRRRFENMLQYKLESFAALKVQTAFRLALGRRRGCAIRRTRQQRHDFALNRRRQGAVLRAVFGLRQRATQRAFLRAAVPWGLDPISFTLSPTSQAKELRKDCAQLITVARREYAVWKCGGLDAYDREMARSDFRAAAEKECELLQGDAVRVIDHRHPRRGQTAFLAAIDKFFENSPSSVKLVYEEHSSSKEWRLEYIYIWEKHRRERVSLSLSLKEAKWANSKSCTYLSLSLSLE